MKLEFASVEIETSQVFENQEFGLGDPRVIQELLSSKIYARPKYIIVQEVASNARDANREAGRAKHPIQIKLPSRLDDNLIIADSGPGISPDRMQNVFLRYGNSTKRSDDTLTGGFGIGAKTPFTYTDTFTITTVTDDANGRHKRIYLAHKADGGMSKMALVSTVPSDEETGTAISFAVKHEDINDFCEAVKSVCCHWEVRPTVTGAPGWTWPSREVVDKGPGWELIRGRNGATVLVDRIPYSVRSGEILSKVTDYKENKEFRYIFENISLLLFFNTGDISVSATREDLDYSQKTVDAVIARLGSARDELKRQMLDSIKNCKTLWDATLTWRNKRHAYSGLVSEPTWNGKSLFPVDWEPSTYNKSVKEIPNYKQLIVDTSFTGSSVISEDDFVKVSLFRESGDKITQIKSWGRRPTQSWGRRPTRRIDLDSPLTIIVDDIGDDKVNRLRLKTWFAANPNKVAVVVQLKPPFGEAIIRRALAWDDLDKVLLSTIAKHKTARSSGGKVTVVPVKSLTSINGNVPTWSHDTSINIKSSTPMNYVIIKNGEALKKDKTKFNRSTLLETSRATKVDVVGVLWKYRNKIPSTWKHYEDALTDKLKQLESDKHFLVATTYGTDTGDCFGIFNAIIKAAVKAGKIADSEFSTVVDAFSQITPDAATALYAVNRARSVLGVPAAQNGNEARDMEKALLDKYPILQYAMDASYSLRKVPVDEIINYINMKYSN